MGPQTSAAELPDLQRTKEIRSEGFLVREFERLVSDEWKDYRTVYRSPYGLNLFGFACLILLYSFTSQMMIGIFIQKH